MGFHTERERERENEREMSNEHVLVLPFPAQGHVNPLMNFSREIAKHGSKITFVSTDFCHTQMMTAMAPGKDSLPDGLCPEDDRNDFRKLLVSILATMPTRLEELIRGINASNGDGKISCIIADGNMGWAMEVANKMGIRGAILWPASAASFALVTRIPNLIDDGFIDMSNGTPMQRHAIQLHSGIPAVYPQNLPWNCSADQSTQKSVFDYVSKYAQAWKLADWWLCNTAYELEPAAFSLLPKLLPVGPIMASDQTRNVRGQFLPEDTSCLNWLDQQPHCSVIYVAFGSFAVLDPIQFQELAFGLELTNRPFLWVVRPDSCNILNDANLNKFESTRGKIIRWAPQPKVLSHPAIACFISHCGWNSTLDGITSGVPFLCWPYFADQVLDMKYICDVWKVGLGLESDQDGRILRGEFRKKVEELVSDESIRARSLELKEMVRSVMEEGGNSCRNFNNFINWLKKG
ncbi:UDP-glycosyltransferase 83A1-like isoform X2 [Juglans microcarpa x Juglans regia]|uniref:UDP-glycosyltransferase 83A1-like isoform X2 n=1 Tax=Juglans microcarpa x Juglans regia TaxID=2249226 RepID=UPI001B7E19E4|nr:UDP-glycosyltransferase 83A1-like isoform X2 [Juglans microcarpa x Juglans regia]